MSKSAARAAVNEAAPIIESGTVAQFQAGGSHTETTTSELRRQYLTEREVEMLCDAARKRGRYGHRDATMILMAYRHGLRCSELVALRWDQVDLEAGRLQVIRSKGSDDSLQPLSGVEIRALRKLRRDQPAGLRHVFVSERGAPMTTNGFFKTLSRADRHGRRASASAAARDRLQARQRRRRYENLGGLSRPPKLGQHRTVHEDGCQALRWFLAGLRQFEAAHVPTPFSFAGHLGCYGRPLLLNRCQAV